MNRRATEIADTAQVHRTRDGRLNVDVFSRTLRPRWTMIKIDGAYYDRGALARWLLDRGTFAPMTRRPLTNDETREVRDARPFRIFGKAPVLNKNRAAGSVRT